MTLTKNTFLGEYSYSLDSKGRINMPARFRQALSKNNKNTFVSTRGMDSCIWVYPLAQWFEIDNLPNTPPPGVSISGDLIQHYLNSLK